MSSLGWFALGVFIGTFYGRLTADLRWVRWLDHKNFWDKRSKG